jgi:chromate reductase
MAIIAHARPKSKQRCSACPVRYIHVRIQKENKMAVQLVGICGPLRAGSFNRKLMLEAARMYGADSFVDADLRVPLYDGDLEQAQGIPASVQLLADQIAGADAVLVVSPEYNQSLSGVLKNALDWVSRTEGSPWLDKPVALLNAAAGRAGGARANYALRLALAPFRARIIAGPEILVAGAQREFDDAGQLTSDFYQQNLSALMAQLKQATQS